MLQQGLGGLVEMMEEKESPEGRLVTKVLAERVTNLHPPHHGAGRWKEL